MEPNRMKARNADEPCRSFANRLEMWRDVQKRFIIDAAIDYLAFGVFCRKENRVFSTFFHEITQF
jgi:hypothetical protein